LSGAESNAPRAADAEFSVGGVSVSRNPKFAAAGQVPAVVSAIDGERFAKSGGPASKVAYDVGSPSLMHPFEAG
jgi:hypothetical protein